MTLRYLAAVLLAAFLWAEMEIQIEGEHGWAAQLPTWRLESHPLLDWLYGGRPLTGYHVWAFCFVFAMFHFPFAAGVPWSWRWELRTIGGYDVFWVVEDALWFVLNRHFGWRKFTRANIWWHKRWFLGLPADYWILGLVGAALIALP